MKNVINRVKTGMNIESKMLAQGLRKEDIAKELNISPKCVRSWIRGKSLPRTARFYTLTRILNCSFEELISK